MAGIYIHVPFCKTRCAYCDFFTQTDTTEKSLYLEALGREIELRSGYLDNETIDTIYFGGGTPSQLSADEIHFILEKISGNFTVNSGAEITLEANPDDLNEVFLQSLFSIGINRLSIGIQSFDDDLLRFLNRRHSAQKAVDIVATAKKAGFENISIDLMYGLPGMSMDIWNDTLDKAIALNVQHISAYHLIYEEGTPLYKQLENKSINPVDEDMSVEMFSAMIDKLRDAGFIHYEISNFGKENFFSKHNTSYWLDTKYLGFGPAAHSYNKETRSWNIASIPLYIEAIKTGTPNLEIETLDLKSRYNDFILTRMRTMWGVDTNELKNRFGENMLRYFLENIRKHISSGHVSKSGDNYSLSRNGIFISDSIMSDLMYIK